VLWVGGGVGVWAQDGATPQHPIDTRPENKNQPGCSYTGTVSNSDGTTTTSSSKECPKNDTAPAGQRFPYPGESKDDLTVPNPQQDPTKKTDGSAGADGTAKTPTGNAAHDFPFPGETPAAKGDESAGKKFPYPGEGGDAGGLKDAGSEGASTGSSSSSGGDAGYSSSSSDDKGLGAPGSGDPNDVNSDTPMAPKRNLHRKPEPPPKTNAEMMAEDLSVGEFYMNDKNWRGAYLRGTDAVKLDQKDPDAHLLLAESARRLGKLDEAKTHYQMVLQLDPVPKTKKAAEKALGEMTGGS